MNSRSLSAPIDETPDDTDPVEALLAAEARSLTEDQQRRLLASETALAAHLESIGAPGDECDVRVFRSFLREEVAAAAARDWQAAEDDTWPGADLDFERKEAAENAA